MGDVTVTPVAGSDAAPFLDDLARLRIAVFHAWPYIYDGDLGYEREYLAAFAAAPGALLAIARDGEQVVGASTAMPLAHAEAAFQAPFRAAGWDVDEVFYFGESVLDAAYRGRGIGHAFFDARETHARRLGARWATFCAVTRPDDHPLKDPAYRPLDPFWRGRGYARRADLVCRLGWKDRGEAEETEKELVFWIRDL